jgi:hypothetical protein
MGFTASFDPKMVSTFVVYANQKRTEKTLSWDAVEWHRKWYGHLFG